MRRAFRGCGVCENLVSCCSPEFDRKKNLLSEEGFKGNSAELRIIG
jgi:hypothetical protein